MAQKNQKTWGSTTKYYKSHTICCVFTLSTIQSLGLFGLFWAIPIMLCCGYNSVSLVLELLTRCSFSSKQGLRNSKSKLSLWSFLSWLWVKKYDVKIPWIKLTIKPECVPQSSASNLRPGEPWILTYGMNGPIVCLTHTPVPEDVFWLVVSKNSISSGSAIPYRHAEKSKRYIIWFYIIAYDVSLCRVNCYLLVYMFWNSYIYIFIYMVHIYIYGVRIYIYGVYIYMVYIYIWCVYIYMVYIYIYGVYIYMVYIYICVCMVYIYIYMYGVYIWCIYIYIHTCLRHIQYLKPPKPFFADRFYFSRGWFHQAPKRKIDFAGNSSCQNQTPHPHIAGIIYPGTYMATRFICSDYNI